MVCWLPAAAVKAVAMFRMKAVTTAALRAAMVVLLAAACEPREGTETAKGLDAQGQTASAWVGSTSTG